MIMVVGHELKKSKNDLVVVLSIFTIKSFF